MERNSVKHIVSILCLLLFLFQVPNTYSTEFSTQEVALTILKDVIGLNVSEYNTNLKAYNLHRYYGVLPQERVECTLVSDESKLKLDCIFANGTLRLIHVLDREDLPHIAEPVNDTLKIAKSFLSRYQNYSGVSYYKELRSILDTVDANKNVTTTSGNVTLSVSVNKKSASFRWIHTINGIQARSKCMVLSVKGGFLNYFIDTWRLYRIGSTDISLSEEEAINIAMNRTKNYSWRVWFGNDSIEVTEFNISGESKTTLCFLNEITDKVARGGDPLTLYPRWHIRLYFDKLYPGYVSGVIVGIWADTKEISHISTTSFVGSPPPNENSADPLSGEEIPVGKLYSDQVPITWIAFLTSIAIMLWATTFYLSRKRVFSKKVPSWMY